MSNTAFDILWIKQDLKNAKETLSKMEKAWSEGDRCDYLARAIPAEKERIAKLQEMSVWGF